MVRFKTQKTMLHVLFLSSIVMNSAQSSTLLNAPTDQKNSDSQSFTLADITNSHSLTTIKTISKSLTTHSENNHSNSSDLKKTSPSSNIPKLHIGPKKAAQIQKSGNTKPVQAVGDIKFAAIPSISRVWCARSSSSTDIFKISVRVCHFGI